MASSYTTADIRNLLLTGHGGAGKTTLADAMLFAAGAVNRKASVADGTSFSDFEKEEKEHVHSIYASVLNLDHQGKRINIIDTPGSPDLIGQAILCLPAVETVVLVVNAQSGVEVVTRRMMEYAKSLDLPRAIVINKIDMPEVDLPAIVAQLRGSFGNECLPINLPTGGGKAVVDCIIHKSGEADFSSVAEAHSALLDSIVEMDEAMMEKYLGGQEPDAPALHAAFIKAVEAGHIIPILFADAKNGVGVAALTDAIAKHFPSPAEAKPWPLSVGEGDAAKPFEYQDDPTKPLLAHAFKVATDPFVGKLAIFRVHQGKATATSQIYLTGTRKAIKLGHVFHVQGKDHREAESIIAGDIGAVAKIEELHTGQILHDDPKAETLHPKPPELPHAHVRPGDHPQGPRR